MPLYLSRPEIFPDDTTVVPSSGSPEQAALIADEIDVGNEDFVERLEQFSDLASVLYTELMKATRNAVGRLMPGRPLRVLDLCSGVGMVSLSLLQTELPVKRLTLADISPELMSRARSFLAKRLGPDHLPPTDTVRLDLLTDDPTDRLAGPFDLILCSNGFQHFPAKRQAVLLRQLRDLLVPNGVLVFASHFKLLRADWKNALVDGYLESMRSRNAPEAFLAQVHHHIHHFHTYVNLREVYEWMEAAGFGFYECVFRQDEVGVLVAVG